MRNKKRNGTLLTVICAIALVMSACGSDKKEAESPSASHAAEALASHEAQGGHEQQDHGEEGQEQGGHGGHGGGNEHGGHSDGGEHGAQNHVNKPVSLSEVTGVVASTSLTALVAEAAGAPDVAYLAPAELRHPPEYDYRPSDIAKVKDSYLVYLGYEPFMAKLIEAGELSPDLTAVIEVDNTPDGYKNATRKLAEIWGTQEAQANFEADLDALAGKLAQAAKDQGTERTKVVSQIYMTPFLKWLGYEVVGEFGPDEPTPSRLAELSKLAPNLIVDNAHMPQGAGFSEISKNTKRIELRSYPDSGMKTLLDILRHNAEQLALLP
ncbi:hypothetical protein J4772_14340 [Cohnella sp. LGH]|uniref:metal ABC transporter solute-binding protein, Zn/Mn family n=1 Tax=Cohnella sp. LGH TaxID=1619153 RepID=UPI001ADC9E8D|nr:zinc ABC transporter substrate-binding protein [Cohnella sp. LGH]QTH45483.1 hypothetical protein J4772_14340 [Cohnella sp. LGH]